MLTLGFPLDRVFRVPTPPGPPGGVSGNESGSLANDLAQLRAELSTKDPEEQKRRMEQRKARLLRGMWGMRGRVEHGESMMMRMRMRTRVMMMMMMMM